MGFRVDVERGRVVVELDGWDRWCLGRRRVEFDLRAVASCGVAQRSDLEGAIDHRLRGIGTHDGARRPGRRRVGIMSGRGVVGEQFWAVAAGPATTRVLVLDLQAGDVARAVLMVDDPSSIAGSIFAGIS